MPNTYQNTYFPQSWIQFLLSRQFLFGLVWFSFDDDFGEIGGNRGQRPSR